MKTVNRSMLYLTSIAVLAGALLFLATMRPQIEYQPGVDSSISGLRSGQYPEQLVETFLWQSQHLPLAGTPLHCCVPYLAWDEHEQTSSFSSEHRIAEVEIHRIELSDWRGLLQDLIDDDPTYSAQVEATVTLENGQAVPIVFRLWEYGLVVPWGIYTYGDGWKPSQVQWQ